MNWKNIEKHYGGETLAVRALKDTLGWSSARIYNYKKRGYLALDAQVLVEVATNGALKADLPQYFRKQAA